MTEGWYLTELIFRIHDSDSPALFQFDKQMRLIEAGSARAAYQNALVMASQELYKHGTQPKAKIQWEFVGIGLLETIELPDDSKQLSSMELHYTIETWGAAKEYLRSLREKNAHLQTQIALSA